MSHNISVSDSEDDDHSTRQSKSQKEQNRVWKYECPPDFVDCKYNCDGAKLEKKKRSTELWLIKAPAHFDHNSLADLNVPLSGLEMIQSTGTSSKIYSVLASRSGPADLHLLTSVGENQDASLCSSSFAGVMSINESYGDCSDNQTLIPVPAAPAPSIPAGLKQRFQPFGSSTASHLIPNTSTSHFSPKKEPLVSEDPEGQRPKKKKRKKDKHVEEERIEVPCIKQENASLFKLEVTEAEEEQKAERKKKKKIKKEKDIQDNLEINASLLPKEEPMDTFYNDIDGSVKRKKKSKKKRHE